MDDDVDPATDTTLALIADAMDRGGRVSRAPPRPLRSTDRSWSSVAQLRFRRSRRFGAWLLG